MRHLFCALLLLMFTGIALSHEGIHEQIEQVSKDIKADPKNPELYIRRGELYRFHGESKKALADYATAQRLNPNLDVADFCRARLYFENRQYPLALKHLDLFLTKHPAHSEALMTRARILAHMKRFAEAVTDYTKGLQNAENPTPEDYIDRANAISAQGPAHFAEAITALDDGIKKLGPIVTLQLPAMDLDIKLKNYDVALKRLDTLAAQSERKEGWLYRRGEILQEAGREAEAKSAFQQALNAVEALPSYLRSTKATQDLESQIRVALNRQ